MHLDAHTVPSAPSPVHGGKPGLGTPRGVCGRSQAAAASRLRPISSHGALVPRARLQAISRAWGRTRRQRPAKAACMECLANRVAGSCPRRLSGLGLGPTARAVQGAAVSAGHQLHIFTAMAEPARPSHERARPGETKQAAWATSGHPKPRARRGVHHAMLTDPTVQRSESANGSANAQASVLAQTAR